MRASTSNMMRWCTALFLLGTMLRSSGTAQKSVDIRLDTDLPGAARSLAPQIAASGDSVYVTWQDVRNGNSDIYFNGSLDGGATWLDSDRR